MTEHTAPAPPPASRTVPAPAVAPAGDGGTPGVPPQDRTTRPTATTPPPASEAHDDPGGPPAPEDAGLPAARARRLLRYWLRRPGLVLATVVVVCVALAALLPTVLTSQDPLEQAPDDRLGAPGGQHLFGTDQLGRDLYARVVHGCALSLEATALAVAVALVAGALIGLVAGYAQGLLGDVLMRAADVLLAIPGLFLSLAIVTALGFGTLKVAVAVGVTRVAAFARVMRAEVLRVRAEPYVEAAHATGSRWWSILLRHVLPNAAGPVLVYALADFGGVVLQVAALNFLGYGAAPPTPEWGALVSDGRDYLTSAWWLSTLPGLTIAALVLAVNRIARALEGETAEGAWQ